MEDNKDIKEEYIQKKRLMLNKEKIAEEVTTNKYIYDTKYTDNNDTSSNNYISNEKKTSINDITEKSLTEHKSKNTHSRNKHDSEKSTKRKLTKEEKKIRKEEKRLRKERKEKKKLLSQNIVNTSINTDTDKLKYAINTTISSNNINKVNNIDTTDNTDNMEKMENKTDNINEEEGVNEYEEEYEKEKRIEWEKDRRREKPRIIVLSGGASKAPAHVGALMKLDSIGYLDKLDKYIGTSIGSKICLLMVAGYRAKDEEIMELTMTLSLNKDIDVTKLVTNYGILTYNNIKEKAKELIIKKIGYCPNLRELYEETGKHFICVE